MGTGWPTAQDLPTRHLDKAISSAQSTSRPWSSTSLWSLLLLTLIGSLTWSTAAQAHGIETCSSLAAATSSDEWALLEYQVGPSGIDREALSLEFSSTWNYGAQLRECAVAGATDLPRQGQGQHTLFRYRPSRDLQEDSRGRRLDFRPSPSFAAAAQGLAGNLAVRVELDETGQLESSELLFASSLELGQLVLDHFEDTVEVVNEGTTGRKVDVVYLRFEQGSVVTFSQLHYAPRH